MRLFNLDLHATVIKDIMDLFTEMGHTVDHWSISSHSWVHGRAVEDVDVVNQYTWRHLNESMCERFYHRYRDELSEYDGFVVTHTPSFALLYAAFNKPVIVVASTRYEAPFSVSRRRWEWLNSGLHALSARQLIGRVANNRYDQRYCELHTGLSWAHVPSYCGHVNVRWSPGYPSFLLDSKMPPVRLRNYSLVHKKSLGTFKWTDLMKYAGIVVIPYNASVMSVFEYYTACIPLFFPTGKFCMELYRHFPDFGVLSELSWLQVWNVGERAVLSTGEHDANRYMEPGIVEDWIRYSDWYDDEWMPHITYFDSFADLEGKLGSVDLKAISEKMHVHNIIRKQKIEALWKQQLKTLMSAG